MKIQKTTSNRKRNVWVFDNTDMPNETFDCFTIVFGNGEMLGSSHNPFYPTGFGQYCGNLVDNDAMKIYGSNWRNRFNNVSAHVRIKVNEFIKQALTDVNWLGKEITDFNALPKDVQQFIMQNIY